jgi:hypothetical protein
MSVWVVVVVMVVVGGGEAQLLSYRCGGWEVAVVFGGDVQGGKW